MDLVRSYSPPVFDMRQRQRFSQEKKTKENQNVTLFWQAHKSFDEVLTLGGGSWIADNGKWLCWWVVSANEFICSKTHFQTNQHSCKHICICLIKMLFCYRNAWLNFCLHCFISFQFVRFWSYFPFKPEIEISFSDNERLWWWLRGCLKRF